MKNEKIRKFNIILPKEDPFKIDENFCSIRRSWDWFFEMKAFEVKKQTLEEFNKLIELVVDNRDFIEEIFSICMIDSTTLERAVDQELHNFFFSQYSRMIKTSKIIQDLTIEGNYIESKSLLRTNFERMILIYYFLTNPEQLRDYNEAKQRGDKKKLFQYSIREMTLKLKKNYGFYKYLCNFVHANTHLDDLMSINVKGEEWGLAKSYNFFEGGESAALLAENSNLLIEAFHPINLYLNMILSKNISNGLKLVLKKAKNIKLIRLGSKNEAKNDRRN
jgi:hypothetical protein